MLQLMTQKMLVEELERWLDVRDTFCFCRGSKFES